MLYTLVDVDGQSVRFPLSGIVAIIFPKSVLMDVRAKPQPAQVILQGVMSQCSVEEAYKLEKAWERSYATTVEAKSVQS